MKIKDEIIKKLIIELEENKKFESEITDLASWNIKYFKTKRGKRGLERLFFYLSTLRNRQLIRYNEQGRLTGAIVAFFGLSVGSHAALTWMMLSRAKIIKISDPDTISSSNLNRLRFGWGKVGKLKADVVKEELQKINPFCKIYKYIGQGKKTVRKIILDIPKPDIIVDSMDDLKSKVLLRLLAKKENIPVLMATDVGDNVFLDIERYDKLPKPKEFNGRIGDLEKIDFSNISNTERKKLSMKIVGLEHNSEEMLESLLSVGKTIKTWPQLGSTSTIAGGLIATVIKKIVLGENVRSGRYYFLIDDLLVGGFNSKERTRARKRLSSELSSVLD